MWPNIFFHELQLYIYIYICVCVCVWEREREMTISEAKTKKRTKQPTCFIYGVLHILDDNSVNFKKNNC